jgi:CheY-like chemotaxis protein
MTPACTHDEMEQLKGTFLTSLNHEIRTPLAGIMGMMDLLLETSLDAEQHEYVSAARICAEHLFEMLNATLEYSALESGQFTLNESEFSLRETVDAALAHQSRKAEAKNLRVSLTLDPSLPETMIGDAPRLRELLIHLIANAIKFTHTGGVDVCVRPGQAPPGREAGDGWLTMQVKDTGIGIPPAKLEAIFELFQQGQRGLSRGYPGLGLGLALARKLADVMGGIIEVKSELGTGSTFTVRLPAHPALRGRAEPRAAAAETAPAILAVDDNPVGLTVLQHTLQRHQLNVDCAGSAREALEAAARRRYDVVLMDLQMPGMDGFEAAAELRRLPGYETVPIVALTASSSDQVREQCRAHGMQAYLSKPVQAAELWAAVSRQLSR